MRVSALRKPYPGALIIMFQGVAVWKGFNFEQPQATRNADLIMRTTNAQPTGATPSGIGRNIEKEQKQTKSAPSAFPMSTSVPGWYISPFDGKKKRTWDNPAPEYAYNLKSSEASQPLVSGEHDL